VGRDDLETLMASDNVQDWCVSGLVSGAMADGRLGNHRVKISTMLLGPPPADYKFVPKHKSSSYDDSTMVIEG
jgi:tRNA-dihydrouridine synthase 3